MIKYLDKVKKYNYDNHEKYRRRSLSLKKK